MSSPARCYDPYDDDDYDPMDSEGDPPGLSRREAARAAAQEVYLGSKVPAVN